MPKFTKDLAEQKLHNEMFEDFIESVKENLDALSCNEYLGVRFSLIKTLYCVLNFYEQSNLENDDE